MTHISMLCCPPAPAGFQKPSRRPSWRTSDADVPSLAQAKTSESCTDSQECAAAAGLEMNTHLSNKHDGIGRWMRNCIHFPGLFYSAPLKKMCVSYTYSTYCLWDILVFRFIQEQLCHVDVATLLFYSSFCFIVFMFHALIIN